MFKWINNVFQIFKYTPVQVCFKGVNTLKSMLMHPKDKISSNQKKDLVYHWECKAVSTIDLDVCI